MNHKKLLPITLALALTGACTLASCSTSQKLSFNANWYYDTTTKSMAASEETLKYSVTFEKGVGLYDNVFSVNYATGTYETKLATTEINGETVYE